MNTLTTPAMSASRLWNAYLGDIRFELVKSLRTPGFSVPTLFFPIMFYVLFGILLGSMRGNGQLAQYTFATYGVFGAMGPGLFGFGVSLAIEREQGLLTFKQALPQPPGSYLFARAVMAMLFVAVISVLLLVLAIFVADVPLTFAQGVQIFTINVLGTLPFCAIGLAVGSWVSGQAAPAIVNLIFLPMAFLSGLWLPLQMLPPFIGDIAPIWPAYHLAQIALDAVGGPNTGTFASHIAALTGVTVLFFWLAMRRLHRRGMRMLGESRQRVSNPLRRVAAMLVVSCSVGLVVAGVMGGNAKVDKESASASQSATQPKDALPTGVAAPASGLIADFDRGTASAAYGTGFVENADSRQGGSSRATIKVIAGGADASSNALEIAGEIKAGASYPWAGAFFFPNDPPMTGAMDYSAHSALSFQARGDGQRYFVMIFAGAEQIPSMYPFETGPDWREVRVPLADYVTDLKRVRGIGIVSNGPEGEFRLQVDSVNMR